MGSQVVVFVKVGPPEERVHQPDEQRLVEIEDVGCAVGSGSMGVVVEMREDEEGRDNTRNVKHNEENWAQQEIPKHQAGRAGEERGDGLAADQKPSRAGISTFPHEKTVETTERVLVLG
jgi:hypothetical protein